MDLSAKAHAIGLSGAVENERLLLREEGLEELQEGGESGDFPSYPIRSIQVRITLDDNYHYNLFLTRSMSS
jgi:hypothetical protein